MFQGKFTIIFVLSVLMIVFQSCKLFSGPDYDILARSTSFEDVQAAVDSAESGDIVRIPRGSSTWTSELTIPDDKKITLRGEGRDNTIIISNMPNPVINMNRSGSRITNIGFELQNTDGRCIAARGIGWRVDHCEFFNTRPDGSAIEGVYAYGNSESDGPPIGLVDHNEFYDSRVVVLGSFHLLANTIWHEPLGLGTNNAVFVEDNEFTRTHGNVMDANYGGRYVFRYNVVNDAYIEAHSVQGNNRSARSWEIYNNTINQVNISMWAPFFLRGGTGVVFNNTITGNWSSGPAIVIDNRRTFQAMGDGGLADGTSPWDGNEDSTGYPARDQIGRSTDEWLWTDENPYPPQEFVPFYQWNNTHEGSNIEVYVHNNCGVHIQENRDYYNNVEKPDYTPYTYPHPLIEEWEGD
jgi:hypothetical protein